MENRIEQKDGEKERNGKYGRYIFKYGRYIFKYFMLFINFGINVIHLLFKFCYGFCLKIKHCQVQ